MNISYWLSTPVTAAASPFPASTWHARPPNPSYEYFHDFCFDVGADVGAAAALVWLHEKLALPLLPIDAAASADQSVSNALVLVMQRAGDKTDGLSNLSLLPCPFHVDLTCALYDNNSAARLPTDAVIGVVTVFHCKIYTDQRSPGQKVVASLSRRPQNLALGQEAF